MLGACAREVPVRIELPPPPTPGMREEEVRPLELPEVEIADLQETPSADQKQVTLSGTLRNQGAGPTRQLSVRVEARNASDSVVLSADASPSTEAIPPRGTATFTVTLENRPDVVRYHVKAITR